MHDFLWHLTGGLGASSFFFFCSISSSFFAPLLPQLLIGDCNFVGLVGLAYSLAWLGLALLSLDCLFSVTFRISFHVIARAWQQFQLGPSFWSVFKAQLATTYLPLPLGPLDPLAGCRRQYALWSLAYCMKFVYTHTHTHMHAGCTSVCMCMFIRLSMSMNESSSKLRIKVYYFLFGSLLFSADLYNNFLHPSCHPSSDHAPPPSYFFQKPSSDCLRIVASVQFEFLRDLHKSFRPHNSTEIAVYSV